MLRALAEHVDLPSRLQRIHEAIHEAHRLGGEEFRKLMNKPPELTASPLAVNSLSASEFHLPQQIDNPYGINSIGRDSLSRRTQHVELPLVLVDVARLDATAIDVLSVPIEARDGDARTVGCTFGTIRAPRKRPRESPGAWRNHPRSRSRYDFSIDRHARAASARRREAGRSLAAFAGAAAGIALCGQCALRLCPSTRSHINWDGVAFLYPRQEAVLADEMGLGKTMQAITPCGSSSPRQPDGVCC